MTNKQKKASINLTVVLGSFFVLFLVAGGIVFAVPFPYVATEVYSVQEPYADIEYYYEKVPVTVRECHTSIPTDTVGLIGAVLNFLVTEDLNKAVEKCENVTKLESVKKSRTVTKYKTVLKERQVTHSASLWKKWTGQTQYRYEA